MAQAGFLEFCLAVNPNYEASWFHEVLTNKLQSAYERVQRGEKVRIIIETPPRHGKSLSSTILFPSWILGKSPELPVIVCSYSADLAEDFGQSTRDIMNDPLYQKIFSSRLRADTQAKAKWKTTEGGGYLAAGVGGAITGKGFKIGIIDDPFKNRQDADSEVMREAVWSWYKSTFYTRQEGKAAIIVIATRWHQDDLIGRLIEQQQELQAAGETDYDQWEVLRFPAIAEEDEKYRKEGEALWPAKFDVPDLNNIRNNMDAYDWSALYQQSPILQENAKFKQEWFRYFEEEDINEMGRLNNQMDVYAMVDLAISQKKQADNTSIQVAGKMPDSPNIFKLEDNTGKLDPLQVIEYLFYLKAKYGHRLKKVGVETVQYQKAMMIFLAEEMRKRQIYFDVVELKATEGSKIQRIEGLIPYYKSGVIFHRRTDREYERELLEFPKGKHDDRIDAFAYLPQLLSPSRGGRAHQFRPKIKRY